MAKKQTKIERHRLDGSDEIVAEKFAFAVEGDEARAAA